MSLAKSGHNPQFTDEELAAIVGAARDYDFTVAVHAHGTEGMKRAVEAGVTSIEHGTFMSDEVMSLMKKNGHEFTGPMRTKMDIKTTAVGETTIITIGNSTLEMHYTDAFQLAHWIRMAAKQAKMNAGDTSRHWSVIGVLDDANVN